MNPLTGFLHSLPALLLLSSLSVSAILQQSCAEENNQQAQEQSPVQAKKSIERFLKRTALRIIEMEWTFGYDNKTPTDSDRARVMLSGGISDCPADFQEAWIKQTQRPGRNYAAPLLRKYEISMPELRDELSRELRKIDSRVRPPIPLYDEEEKPPRFDPMTCGPRDAILAAITKLDAKLSGIDPAQAAAWKQAIHDVMTEFMLSYMETAVCMNAAGIPRDDVSRMFNSIKVQACPEDFRKAWAHDIPFFCSGQFNSPELQLSPVCKKYGVDENAILTYIRRKMQEWDIATPTISTQPRFREDMKELRQNIMDGRKSASKK